MMTRDEIEVDRRDRLDVLERENAGDADWRERFKPSSFGCHEALHTTSIMQAFVEDNLVDHPAVLLDPEWFALASRASEALADLYQAIGQRHCER